MPQNLDQLRQLLDRLRSWVAVACILAVILIGYFAVQGFRYWRAWSQESSIVREISVLDRRIAAVSPTGDMAEKIEALKQQLEANDLLLADRGLQLEELNGLFHYPSTDDLLKIVANTVQETGLNLISITAGELQTETVGLMAYQVREVGLTLGGEPADFYKFLAQLQEMVPVASATNLRLSKLDEDPSAQVTLLFFLSPVTVPTPTPKPGATKVPYPTPSPGLRETSTPVGSAGPSPRQGPLVHRARR